jgi:hypothetical protein
MSRRGHTACFYERNVPYYASARDGWEPPTGVRLRLYDSLDDIRSEAARELAAADAAFCTSYCPDGPEAARLMLDSSAVIKSFYDLDTPVTLKTLYSDETVPYLPTDGLGPFDVVLSYTGGRALGELQTRLGRVASLRSMVPLMAKRIGLLLRWRNFARRSVIWEPMRQIARARLKSFFSRRRRGFHGSGLRWPERSIRRIFPGREMYFLCGICRLRCTPHSSARREPR